jgi:hypothetical protein
MHRQAVKLESRYVILPMNSDLKYSNQLPLENSNALSTLVKKGRRFGGQQAILLINENFDPRTVDTNIVQLFIRPTWGGCSKYESVVKIQNKHAATLWSNDDVQYHKNSPCGQLWQVSDLKEWPTLQTRQFQLYLFSRNELCHFFVSVNECRVFFYFF